MQPAPRVEEPILPHAPPLVQILLLRRVVRRRRGRGHLQHEFRRPPFLPNPVRRPETRRHPPRHEHVRGQRLVRIAFVVVDQQILGDMDVRVGLEAPFQRVEDGIHRPPLPLVVRHRLSVLVRIFHHPRPRRPQPLRRQFQVSLRPPLRAGRRRNREGFHYGRQALVRFPVWHARLPGAPSSRLRSIPCSGRGLPGYPAELPGETGAPPPGWSTASRTSADRQPCGLGPPSRPLEKASGSWIRPAGQAYRARRMPQPSGTRSRRTIPESSSAKALGSSPVGNLRIRSKMRFEQVRDHD